MSNRQPGEFAFIDQIRNRAASHAAAVIGVGDDAALIEWANASRCLAAVDVLMEGVHFEIPPATGELVGRKALAVNLSDVAAMAGRPTACLVGLVVPRERGYEFAREVQTGIETLADEFDVAVAGGDTNVWDGPLVVSVTVLGEPVAPGPVTRGGAQVGDWILVTGSLGGSRAGRHLTFTPRVAEALALHAAADLHAMIDLSDGLASDLRHILKESRVGAVVEEAAIPVGPDVVDSDKATALEQALGDGEDFELLLSVSPKDGRRLRDSPPTKVPLTHIGEIVAGEDCELAAPDGTRRPMPRLGWEH